MRQGSLTTPGEELKATNFQVYLCTRRGASLFLLFCKMTEIRQTEIEVVRGFCLWDCQTGHDASDLRASWRASAFKTSSGSPICINVEGIARPYEANPTSDNVMKLHMF